MNDLFAFKKAIHTKHLLIVFFAFIASLMILVVAESEIYNILGFFILLPIIIFVAIDYRKALPLLICLLFFPFYKYYQGSKILVSSQIIFLIIISLCLILIFLRRISIKKIEIPVYLFFGAATVSFLINPKTLNSFVIILNWCFSLTLLVIIPSLIASYERLEKAIKYVIIGGFFAAILGLLTSFGIWQSIDPTGVPTMDLFRIRGTFSDSNIFAGVLLISMSFLTYFIFQEKSYIASVMLILSFLILIYALSLTFTRGAYIGLFTGVVVLILYTFKIGHFKKQFWSITTVVLLIMIPFYVNLEKILDRYAAAYVDVQRLGIWESSIKIIISSPIFGIGPGQFMERFPIFKSFLGYSPTYWHSHNTYLTIGAEFGLLAMLSYVWLLLIFFVKMNTIIGEISNPKWKYLGICLIVSLVSVSTSTVFDYFFFDVAYPIFFGVYLGLIRTFIHIKPSSHMI